MMELKEKASHRTVRMQSICTERTEAHRTNYLTEACAVLFRLPQILLSQVQELAQNTSVIILLPSLTALCPGLVQTEANE